MANDIPELKPCPFCGGTEIDTHGDDKVVGYHCLTCEAVGPNHYITFPKPREWNTRAAPKVKPLAWYGRKSDDIMFQYRIHIGYRLEDGNFVLTLSGSTIGEYKSECDAKDAAQADYERRILSALEGLE